MKLYEITGCRDSEFNGMVFGHFTSKELAEKAYSLMSTSRLMERSSTSQKNKSTNIP